MARMTGHPVRVVDGTLVAIPGESVTGTCGQAEMLTPADLAGAPGRDGVSPVLYAAKGVTDVSGLVTFTYPVDLFSLPPVVTYGLMAPSASVSVTGDLVAMTKDAVTIKVFKPAVQLSISLGMNTLIQVGAGVEVHVMASPAT